MCIRDRDWPFGHPSWPLIRPLHTSLLRLMNPGNVPVVQELLTEHSGRGPARSDDFLRWRLGGQVDLSPHATGPGLITSGSRPTPASGIHWNGAYEIAGAHAHLPNRRHLARWGSFPGRDPGVRNRHVYPFTSVSYTHLRAH